MRHPRSWGSRKAAKSQSFFEDNKDKKNNILIINKIIVIIVFLVFPNKVSAVMLAALAV